MRNETQICTRRGAGFSRFLQLIPGEGESQTIGKLCVWHTLNLLRQEVWISEVEDFERGMLLGERGEDVEFKIR